LGLLIYIPYLIYILLIFNDKGEIKNRYQLEEPGLKEKIDSVITSQKISAISRDWHYELNLSVFLNDLKNKLWHELRRFESKPDLISFHYNFGSGNIKGTELNGEEIKNERVSHVRNIIAGQGSQEVTNLLSLLADSNSENKLKLNCIVVFSSKENSSEINQEEGIVLFNTRNKRKSDLADEVDKRFSLNLSVAQKMAIEQNFGSHIDASKIGNKDYFLYIIRPSEDINNLNMYLVLLKSHWLKNETIASLQTLLDLILLKYTGSSMNRFKEENFNLKNQIEKIKNEKQKIQKIAIETKKIQTDNERNMLKDLIGRDALDLALEKTLEMIRSKAILSIHENTILTYLNQHRDFYKKQLMGTLQPEEINSKNRIVTGSLKAIDDIFIEIRDEK